MNRSGIVWSEDYGGLGCLELSEETATGFVEALGAVKAFSYGDPQADANLFLSKGGGSPAVEAAHILYYAGHGSQHGPVLGSHLSNASYDAVRLGRGFLSYAVFDCCQMLDTFYLSRWHQVFEGLHYMLGFSRFVWQECSRGKRFSEFLLRCESISEAWRRASIETSAPTPTWWFLRAVHDGPTASEEYWSNENQLSGDPTPPLIFLSRDDRVEYEMSISPEVVESSVQLFRTPRRFWAELDREALAARLGLVPAEESGGPGWLELRNAEAALEFYQGSGAFWFRRVRPTVVLLFPESMPIPPPIDRAILDARSYLEQVQLADERSVLDSVAATMEIHHRPGSVDRVGVLKQWTVGRHVNYSYLLAGLPVFGPGAKLQVGFEGERVSEVLRFWREPIQEGSVAVITPEIARQRLLASDRLKQVPREALTLNGEPRLGYYARPPRDDQDYLLPVYEFQGDIVKGDFRFRFTFFVQAVPEGERPLGNEGSVFRLPEVLP